MLEIFGDIDGLDGLGDYADDLFDLNPKQSTNPLPDDFLVDIPQEVVLTPAQLEQKRIAERQDEVITYTPKETPVKEEPVAPQIPVVAKMATKTAVKLQKPVVDRSGSFNKISATVFEDPDSINTVSVPDRDLELLALAGTYDIFSLKEVSDHQVASPTSAEFISEYYRLINTMISKVTLNQLVESSTEVYGLWMDGVINKTINISGNAFFYYDAIYRYCVQDSVVKSLRIMYDNKKVHFTQMQTYQIMGAGKGISSAQQATYYLEKMATASFSTTIGVLVHRKNMVKIREWFESSFPSSDFRSGLLSMIQNAISESSKQQAIEFKSDDNVFVVAGHRCLLFAKKLLHRHSNIQLPNNHLQLSALVFLLSGVTVSKPNLRNIGFEMLLDGLDNSPQLMESFVTQSYESHRHCYPITDLSSL